MLARLNHAFCEYVRHTMRKQQASKPAVESPAADPKFAVRVKPGRRASGL